MLRLSIIGCGNVAKTLAHLWHQTKSVDIVDVVNRSQASADDSVRFIGAGNALFSIDNLQLVDVFIIGCGDDQIESCCEALAKLNIIQADTIVCHFSGAKSSAVLESAIDQGAKCASLHSVKSFADPSSDIKNFADTYCGFEGHKQAVDVLEKLVKLIGGHNFKVDADKKLNYHSASVFACNYMVALQELSIKAFEYSGVDRDLAMKILEPIVKETADNIFQLGTAKALTGPIARGDHQLVNEQFSAVKKWDNEAAEIYRLLGKFSVDLSNEKGLSDKSELRNIQNLFMKNGQKVGGCD